MEDVAHSIRLDYEEVYRLLEEWVDNPPEKGLSLDEKKHSIRGEGFELKLPLPMPFISAEERNLSAYFNGLSPDIPPYIIMLVQVGAASLGYYEGGEVFQHKAFKKYMKRHKRGKAQISYLNTRGKSKAGSRIRLANTVRFFEEINERLTDYEELYDAERILYSITPQLWGLMFASKVPVPFEKKDPRLIKIPRDVKTPDFEEMERLNEIFRDGFLQIADSDIPEFLKGIGER